MGTPIPINTGTVLIYPQRCLQLEPKILCRSQRTPSTSELEWRLHYVGQTIANFTLNLFTVWMKWGLAVLSVAWIIYSAFQCANWKAGDFSAWNIESWKGLGIRICCMCSQHTYGWPPTAVSLPHLWSGRPYCYQEYILFCLVVMYSTTVLIGQSLYMTRERKCQRRRGYPS